MIDESYFRIIELTDEQGLIVGLQIVEVQWFDELDYSPLTWFTDDKFESQEDARDYIEDRLTVAKRLQPMFLGRTLR